MSTVGFSACQSTVTNQHCQKAQIGRPLVTGRSGAAVLVRASSGERWRAAAASPVAFAHTSRKLCGRQLAPVAPTRRGPSSAPLQPVSALPLATLALTLDLAGAIAMAKLLASAVALGTAVLSAAAWLDARRKTQKPTVECHPTEVRALLRAALRLCRLPGAWRRTRGAGRGELWSFGSGSRQILGVTSHTGNVPYVPYITVHDRRAN